MTITFKQTLYRIQQPNSSRASLQEEIEKVLEREDYTHITKTKPHSMPMMPAHITYLFFQRDDAFGIMQSIMRNLGLIEDGWDFEDIVLDGSEDLEPDETPEQDDWRIVEETIILNAQAQEA